ncbi:hypothetical protein [Solibacillus isronensis]|uniref:hypothetical protein n=1 Tax=Solibacillus isronensis TaxID=412383 RepID=UPI0009A74638|nr:hypothetical protein [Solibacillus isronensis]
MSETTATALKFAAGIILAIVLVGISIMVFTPAADSAKSVTNDFTNNTTELQDQKYLMYDNTVVSGSQVINAIRKFKGQEGEIGVEVTTGKSTKWYLANFTGDELTKVDTDLLNATTNTHADYINPSGMFDAEIERDSNGVIRAIKFNQQKQN